MCSPLWYCKLLRIPSDSQWLKASADPMDSPIRLLNLLDTTVHCLWCWATHVTGVTLTSPPGYIKDESKGQRKKSRGSKSSCNFLHRALRYYHLTAINLNIFWSCQRIFSYVFVLTLWNQPLPPLSPKSEAVAAWSERQYLSAAPRLHISF